MRIFSLLLVLFISSCTNSNLPKPYNELETVLPFDAAGWYTNGKHLKKLIKENKVESVVEVGSWLGQSTLHIAKHLPKNGKIYAVDHWLGSEEHQEGQHFWTAKLPYLYEQFLSNVIHKKMTHKVIPIRMPSVEAEKELTDVMPDLIYIDAAHDEASVFQDLTVWYPHVKGHGILCGDDWGWEGVQAAVKRFAKENGMEIEAEEAFWRLIER